MKEFRVSLRIERLSSDSAGKNQLLSDIEVARFNTAEEAAMYRYRLTCCSPVVTGEKDLLTELMDSKQFTAGD